MAKVSAVPPGMHTVIPVLTIKGCAEAIEFYKKAFGAEEMSRAPDPSGKFIWHAALRIGDSTIFLSDEMPEQGVTARPSQLWLYLDGVDAAFKRASSAGCKVTMPLADMFWGDRMGKVEDKWGNDWSLAQHIKDLTPQEMRAAQNAFIEQMSKKK
jgi:PhnB protein